MGGIYAREEGQPEQVWKAIYYQYLPIGVEADAPPTAEQLGAAAVSWAALSMADKLDTFVSLSRAGEKATGSRDPFALRRQVQGVVRTLMDLPELTGIDREVPLRLMVEKAAERAPAIDPAWSSDAALGFALERVRFALEHRGLPGEVVRAATPPGDVNPLRARRVAEALQSMRTSEDFQALAVLFKRVKNIARELKGQATLDRAALVEPAERALLEELDARRPRIDRAVAKQEYRAAMADIAGLRAPVDRFFTDVFVMADDPRLRTARLALMAELRDLVLQLADISEIIPQTE
jgi:glycyl-tRNA synthetase beta chain